MYLTLEEAVTLEDAIKALEQHRRENTMFLAAPRNLILPPGVTLEDALRVMGAEENKDERFKHSRAD